MKKKLVTFRVADLGFPNGVDAEEAVNTHHAAGVSAGVTIVILKLADMGFVKCITTRKIIGTHQDTNQHGNAAPFTNGRGQHLGLELCPPEVAPHYRLEYEDQPLGERLYVAMKPITTSDGEPRIFVLEHNADGLSLNATRARSDDTWQPSDKFMFCIQS